MKSPHAFHPALAHGAGLMLDASFISRSIDSADLAYFGLSYAEGYVIQRLGAGTALQIHPITYVRNRQGLEGSGGYDIVDFQRAENDRWTGAALRELRDVLIFPSYADAQEAMRRINAIANPIDR